MQCLRIRFAVSTVSFVGFLVFLALRMWPAPPVLLPSRPQASRGVSVVLVPSGNESCALEFSRQLARAIRADGLLLDPEFLVAVEQPDRLAWQGLGVRVRWVRRCSSFSATVAGAFDQAHFSLLLVVGDLAVPVESIVPKLVKPVVQRSSDLTLAQSNGVSYLLSALALPLTGCLQGAGNSSVFCFHRAVWMRGCGAVDVQSASVSLELMSKCSLHAHSTVWYRREGSAHQPSSTTQILIQVCKLYWELHPFLCVSVCALSILFSVSLRIFIKHKRSSMTII